MLVRQFRIEGLGHLSTLIADDAAGVAAVIDPRRDVDVYLAAARELDVRISHVVETHLHNDYVSGGRDLANLTGASHVIGAGAGLAHEHRPLRDLSLYTSDAADEL
jgi:hydroxyacylglutathione hydrolase